MHAIMGGRVIGFMVLAVLASVAGVSAVRAPLGAPPVAERSCPVAVLNFEASDKALAPLGGQVARLLAAHLSGAEGMIVVEREELAKVLSEQELALSGTVDPSTAAKAGRLTGAKVLICGSVFAEGNETVVIAKLVSTETSRLFTATARADQKMMPTVLCEQLGTSVAAAIRENLEAILAETETREAFVARLRQKVAGRKLPVVTVAIAESHNRQAILDPAAETEVGALLKELGFELVDRKDAARADIEITGESLSEFGARRGSFAFCRGRVEIKATDRRMGTVLAVDSQTEGAMDLGEHIAGKTALQKAAARWLERNIDKLVAE